MDLFSLSQALFNQYLLASESTIRIVLDRYSEAIQNGPEYVGLIQRPLKSRKSQAKIQEGPNGKVGILQVKGPLTYEESGWDAICGMTSYEALQGQAEYMIKEAKVKQIVLEANSGGGMAYGCFEAAQAVRKMADEHNVKITTYVDGVAFSGGYAWASIADEVISNPMGKVGSIGVVLPLVNRSEQDKKNGVKRIYVTSGKSKVPFDEDGNFTKEALAEMEKQSNEIYDMFVNHVAEMRGIDSEAVRNTEAKTFMAKDALELGLIDSIMTKEQFYEHIDSLFGENIMSLDLDNKATVSKEQEAPLVSVLTEQITTLKDAEKELIADKNALTAKVSSLEEQISKHDEVVSGLQARIAELEAEKAKISEDARREQISALVSVDEVESVMELVEGMTDDKFEKFKDTLVKKNEAIRASFEEQGQTVKEQDTAPVSIDSVMANRVKEKKKTV